MGMTMQVELTKLRIVTERPCHFGHTPNVRTQVAPGQVVERGDTGVERSVFVRTLGGVLRHVTRDFLRSLPIGTVERLHVDLASPP